MKKYLTAIAMALVAITGIADEPGTAADVIVKYECAHLIDKAILGWSCELRKGQVVVHASMPIAEMPKEKQERSLYEWTNFVLRVLSLGYGAVHLFYDDGTQKWCGYDETHAFWQKPETETFWCIKVEPAAPHD